MFCAAFLSNLPNNLSYIVYRKRLTCLALPFLANLSNDLSYIFYRKFPMYFALVISAI